MLIIISVSIITFTVYPFISPHGEYPYSLPGTHIEQYMNHRYDEISDVFYRMDNTVWYIGYAYDYSVVPGINPTGYTVQFNYDTKKVVVR